MYNQGAKQYQKLNVSSEVLEADPHRLIQILLEAALSRLAQAKGAMSRQDMATKGVLLGKVADIVQSLQTSLNHSQGGELSQQLERLYDYIAFRLVEASSQNDIAMIDEVMELLLTVKGAWDGIREEYLRSQQAQTPPLASNGHILA